MRFPLFGRSVDFARLKDGHTPSSNSSGLSKRLFRVADVAVDIVRRMREKDTVQLSCIRATGLVKIWSLYCIRIQPRSMFDAVIFVQHRYSVISVSLKTLSGFSSLL